MSTSLEIDFHPLVLLNTTDHFIRNKNLGNGSRSRSTMVIGALLGSLVGGRNIIISNSFEIPLETVSGAAASASSTGTATTMNGLDDFLSRKVIGWYSCVSASSDASESDLDSIHQIFSASLSDNSSCLHLHLNTALLNHATTGLECLQMFESVKDPKTALTRREQIGYHIESNEAEGIAVQHVALASTDAKTIKFVAHLSGQGNALDMLSERILIVKSYLQGIQNGTYESDPALLSSIASLITRLPCGTGPDFADAFHTDSADVSLSAYLALLLRSAEDLLEMKEKTQVLANAAGMGGGGGKRSGKGRIVGGHGIMRDLLMHE